LQEKIGKKTIMAKPIAGYIRDFFICLPFFFLFISHFLYFTIMTVLGRGIFVPVPTFFKENEDLDLEAFDKHIQYLSKSGIAGVVVLGSMGEAVNLSESERNQVIEQCAASVKKYNPELKVIAGTSSQSARVTLQYIQQAKTAGAQYALVLPPSFYKGSLDHEALSQFYTHVADESPLPVVIYNYPGVCQGLDLSIKLLVELAKHKNIIGIKGTDGNVGKMANLVNKTNPDGKLFVCLYVVIYYLHVVF
jgi:L-threo-3-deoxy-hexylosonate aldolase